MELAYGDSLTGTHAEGFVARDKAGILGASVDTVVSGLSSS